MGKVSPFYEAPVPDNPVMITVLKPYENDRKHIIGVEQRYMWADGDTGEIFDDARGYGYKSKHSAEKAFSYKNHTSEEFEEYFSKCQDAYFWAWKHPKLAAKIDKAIKKAKEKNKKLSDEEFEELLGEHKNTVTFTVLHFAKRY